MGYSIIEETEGVDFQIAAEPEAARQLNRELNLARTVVEETGANLFLTGKAGTGKTTFLRHLADTSRKRLAVLAPTGVAAINAHGVTIHSMFQFPFSPFVPGRGFVGEEKKYFRFSKAKTRLIKSLDLIVIDEVSMVRPDTLDAIDDLLRRVRGCARPFGGVQLLLIGDLRQLAPVVREEEWRLLAPFYRSPYFFESRALAEAGFITVELLEIYRQTDRNFIGILNAVREGTADVSVLNALNSRCRPGFAPAEEEGYIRLTTHNRMADSINESRLASLPDSGMMTYHAKTEGNFPASSFPADAELTLKPGARVMFIKNDTGAERRYFNGMQATVVRLSEESATVRPLDGSPDIEVEPAEWENTGYDIDEETSQVTQRIEGVFRQLPLRLAWAITIHKSQGLTFDRAIIDAARSFAPGQAYVALSRCRTLEGLVLDSPLPPAAVITDGNVSSFIDSSRRSRPDGARIAQLKAEFCRSLLADLFDLDPLMNDFRDLKRIVFQYVAPQQSELFDLYNKEEETFAARGVEIGRKFTSLYANAPVAPESISDFLLGKIKGGCAYFDGELARMETLVEATPASLDNKAYQKILDSALDRLHSSLTLKRHILQTLSDTDFSPAAYTDAKARGVIRIETEGMKSKKKAKERKPKAEKKPKGYSKHESLALFKAGKSVEEIAEERCMAVTTIIRHLTDLVEAGLLPLRALVSEEAERIMIRDLADYPDDGFTERRDRLEGRVSPVEFSAYYNVHSPRRKSGRQ
ncbi:MAG: AAA family ATPase [Muribaculaceae bacterium]|nr:AAA family ATPase [Muribaculaceae bacterium]